MLCSTSKWEHPNASLTIMKSKILLVLCAWFLAALPHLYARRVAEEEQTYGEEDGSARRLVTHDAQRVQPGEYNNVVALTIGNLRFCTGTLISPGVVLTAAHCIVAIVGGGKSAEAIKVLFTDGTSVGVSSYKVHPRFIKHLGYRHDQGLDSPANKKLWTSIMNGEKQHMRIGIADLGILYLNKCATDVRPVQLRFRRPGDAELVCQDATVVGYGNMMSGIKWRGKMSAKKSARIARKTTVRIHSLEACEQLFPFHLMERMRENKFTAAALKIMPGLKKRIVNYLRNLHPIIGESIICSAAKTKQLQLTSSGDSGGPMFVNGVQVGVLSEAGGFMYSGYGHVSYHVRVDGYIEWIEKHAIDKCKSSSSYGQRLRKQPKQRRLSGIDLVKFLVQNNGLRLTDAKVFKALRYMIDFDRCPASDTSYY